jgi:hypothetical protein
MVVNDLAWNHEKRSSLLLWNDLALSPSLSCQALMLVVDLSYLLFFSIRLKINQSESYSYRLNDNYSIEYFPFVVFYFFKDLDIFEIVLCYIIKLNLFVCSIEQKKPLMKTWEHLLQTKKSFSTVSRLNFFSLSLMMTTYRGGPLLGINYTREKTKPMWALLAA